jgi:hypothetical protein
MGSHGNKEITVNRVEPLRKAEVTEVVQNGSLGQNVEPRYIASPRDKTEARQRRSSVTAVTLRACVMEPSCASRCPGRRALAASAHLTRQSR